MVSRVPPLKKGENLVRTWNFGFDLVQSTPPRSYVGAGMWRLIAQEYGLVVTSLELGVFKLLDWSVLHMTPFQ